jgi:raffinose/stachyose/melibiose transport system substrate-binding protein
MLYQNVRVRSRLWGITSLLIVLMLVVSCGGQGTPEDTGATQGSPAPADAGPASPAASPAGAASPEASPQTGTDAGAPVTLRILHWSPSMVEETPWWNEVLEGFKATHPNVTFENNFVAFAQYLPTLESQAASDSLPDVFFAHVRAAELGRAGRTINYKDVFDDEFFNQFYEGPLRQFTFDDDAVYAVPWTAQTFGLFVNNQIMQELNLQPPETWDDLIAMAPTIRDAGYTPLVWGNQARNVCPDFWLPLVTQYGGDVYALDDLTEEGVTWNSEPVVQSLELLKRLVDAGAFVEGINGVTEEQGQQLFYQGRAAMLFGGSWLPATIAEQAPEELANNYSVHPNPALEAGGRHWTANGSGEGWAVNAQSPNQELAIEFVEYMFSPEVYTNVITGSQNLPSMPSAVDQIENEKVQTMATWLEDGANHILFGQGSWDAVSNVCQGILDGSIEPAAGAAQIQQDVEATRAR